MVRSGKLAPVLAAGERGGASGFGFSQRLRRKYIRDAVGVDRDQAHRALGFQGAEPLAHARLRQALRALRQKFGTDEIAVGGAPLGTARNLDFAPQTFLVDRHQPAAAVGERTINADDSHRRLVQELDEAALMANTGLVDIAQAQERAVADSGRGSVTRLPPEGEANFRRLAVLGRIPLGGLGDELAVPVAAGDLGDDDLGQPSRDLKTAAASVDLAFFPEPPQQIVQFGFACGIQPEGAHDFAFRHAAAAFLNEGKQLLADRGRGVFRFFGLFGH